MVNIIIGLTVLVIIMVLICILHKNDNRIKDANLLEKDVVLIQNSKDMRIIITGCTIIIGAMWLLFVYIGIDRKWSENQMPLLITTFVLAVAIYSLLHVWNWKVIVKGKKIIYTNCFLKSKEYSFDQLQIVVKPSLTIKVYMGKRKIFVIDNNMDNNLKFMYLADMNKVPRMR